MAGKSPLWGPSVRTVAVQVSKIRFCRTCGEPIALIQNKAGKWYPVDANKPSTHGEIEVSVMEFHRCNVRPSYQISEDELLKLYRAHLAENPEPECDWWTPPPMDAETERITEIANARHWYDSARGVKF